MQSKTTTFSLIALCALLGVLLLWRVAIAGDDKKTLASRVDTLTQELAVAKQQALAAAHQPAAAVEIKQPVAAAPVASDAQQRAASLASIAKLNEDLAAARSRVSELESKILSIDADRATLAQQRQQELTAAEETCRAKIADAQQSLATLQSDLKSSQQRATMFEAENENLRKAQASAVRTVAHSSAPSPEGELDELSRRRDAYLKSLIRRYRDIDNDYRAFMRDPQGPHSSDPAILRIQATLSQAEEDLRQIDSLNAKTLLVEKRHEKN